ncbi:flagellar basal body rod protein FlgC [Ectobacillus antri]|jgi:flagellar basal-body rod protein FlgC|uniref:Flagellar basal-body rod protein FlgC n=1 Tax=Ectobacillus antri TaxID=2486280 RepID=A0ABT6H246_9BACI|nr:flagellar basal body rod protein FlgC [Ectobacillus antri]MDG4656193.1 flagellar basal body rod protein FlgC [Ectobacillus antri]MDG5752868.1 flagellar basal body rod protein FlgC [Ectobacillus antri]
MFNALNISGSGLTAAKKWMEVTSNNIVNMNTTNGPNEAPYFRQRVVLQDAQQFSGMLESTGKGVHIKSISVDQTERLVYEPTHPHANAEGYVRYPNVDLTAEMTNAMIAQKMYEANTSVLNANKKMLDKDLEIGRA